MKTLLARVAAVVALLVLALVVANPATAQDGPATTTGKSEPIYTEFVNECLNVETPHGTIHGEITRPVVPDGEKVPIILTYSPYNVISSPVNRPGCNANDAVGQYFAPRGYARARFDVVGTRESQGCYDYGGIRERETAVAVIEALGTAEWSNGKVGMIGGSYDGTTQIAGAVEAPEHLAAIIPQVAIDRWYDYAYGGGIRYFLNSEDPSDEGFDTPLAFDFGFGLLPPSDPSDPGQFAGALGDRITPCDQIEHTDRGYDPDPVYDEFWEQRDYRRDAQRVQAAVLIEGGWLDHNVKHWDSTQFFLALPDDHPKKLVMGQWDHSANQFEDAQDIRHAWFDHWLLGLDTGVMDLPPVDTELNTGERVQEPSWPPPGTEIVELSLGLPDAGAPLTLDGDEATWSDDNPALTEEQMFEGACFGSCLLYLTEPLEEETRISGGPQLVLHAVTDAPSTHFTPVLFEQAEDGTRTVITRGFLNSRNRDGLDTSEPVTPGEAYRAPVAFWDTDHVAAAGSRLGVAIASSNAAWVLPEDDSRATTSLDPEASSYLELPLSRGAGQFQPPPCEPPDECSPSPDPTTSPTGGGTTTNGDGAAGTAGSDTSTTTGTTSTTSSSSPDGDTPSTGGGLAAVAAGLVGAAALARRRRG